MECGGAAMEAICNEAAADCGEAAAIISEAMEEAMVIVAYLEILAQIYEATDWMYFDDEVIAVEQFQEMVATMEAFFYSMILYAVSICELAGYALIQLSYCDDYDGGCDLDVSSVFEALSGIGF